MTPSTTAFTAITVTALLAHGPIHQHRHEAPPQFPAPLVRTTVHNDVANEAERQLDAICALAENWDGYGGAALHPETQAHARAALQAFQGHGPIPELIPNPNGTVSFEWASPRGDAHIEIGRTRYVGMIRSHGSEFIPVAGDADQHFHNEMRAVAQLLSAALFPARSQSVTTIKYPAGNDCIAA